MRKSVKAVSSSVPVADAFPVVSSQIHPLQDKQHVPSPPPSLPPPPPPPASPHLLNLMNINYPPEGLHYSEPFNASFLLLASFQLDFLRDAPGFFEDRSLSND